MSDVNRQLLIKINCEYEPDFDKDQLLIRSHFNVLYPLNHLSLKKPNRRSLDNHHGKEY